MEIIDLTKNCITTECSHSFHASCLMKNVVFNGFGCPYCRFEMVEEIEDSEDEDDEYSREDDGEDDGEDDEEDEEDEEDEDGEEEDGDDEHSSWVLPSFELIQKKFIEQGITYESLIKTIMFNSMVYHNNENIVDYQRCNTFMEELFYETITNYKPEQEEEVKQEENKEFNFYFLQDEYSQRKYKNAMETSLEKFLDLDNIFNDSFLDATTNFLNNRFMEVV
jgi:hypothetical protein